MAEENREYSQNEIRGYVTNLIKQRYSCDPLCVKYLGGGSYGMAYKVQIDIPPFLMVVKVLELTTCIE